MQIINNKKQYSKYQEEKKIQILKFTPVYQSSREIFYLSKLTDS